MVPEPWADGWAGLGEGSAPFEHEDALARAFARCFRDAHGALAIEHLRRAFLERRVSPSASDAELRHVEGQRALAAHILALIERGRE